MSGTNNRPTKGNGKPRGKRDYRKDSVKDEKNQCARGYNSTSASGGGHNDVSWYLHNNQLAKDVASFSFNSRTGDRITLKGYGSASVNVYMPGIYSIQTMPSIGYCAGAATPTAPANQAASMIYSYVRHANSGHSNYDSPDLMLYLLAMDSIYTYWAYLVRAYGISRTVSMRNTYVGDAMLKAMHIDPDNLRDNMADFRAYINSYAARVMAWAVPRVMNYFTRHSWMYSNIYRDEDVAKSQFYMYNPAALFQYQLDNDTGAGMLGVYPICSNISSSTGALSPIPLGSEMSVNALKTKGDALINAMMGVEDIGIMSGDILKAYGEGNLWRLPEIPEDYKIEPVFSEEVLIQIHNTSFCGTFPIVPTESSFQGSADCLTVKQTTGVGNPALIHTPLFRYARPLTFTHIFDSWKEDVTPESVLVGTRNMMAGEAHPNSASYIYVRPASELCLYGEILVYTSNGLVSSLQGDNGGGIVLTQDLTRFNEYPHGMAVDNTGVPTGYVGEISNYTTIGVQELIDLHTTALLSLFSVPIIK